MKVKKFPAHLGGIFRGDPLGREFVAPDFIAVKGPKASATCFSVVFVWRWRWQLWSWSVRGNEVTAVVVWRDNNDARLRLCDRPLIRSCEGHFRYTPDADDSGVGISPLRLTDKHYDANENACDDGLPVIESL